MSYIRKIIKTADGEEKVIRSRRSPIRNYQPVESPEEDPTSESEPTSELTWWEKLLSWFGVPPKTEQQKRFDRIAKMRKEISGVLTCKVPKKFKKKKLKIDYSKYEKVASAADIQDGIPNEYMITDENSVTYVDQAYVSRLLENIAQGKSPALRLSKPDVPNVIGLWADEILDSWTRQPKRLDTEEEYFACRMHSMNSYIDDDWSDAERKMVWQYLRTHKKKLENVVIGRPYYQPVGDYKICTDGKYFWHESLEDMILKYNVRPPTFFVDYILAQIKDEQL